MSVAVAGVDTEAIAASRDALIMDKLRVFIVIFPLTTNK
jgi:hypothetical protein